MFAAAYYYSSTQPPESLQIFHCNLSLLFPNPLHFLLQIYIYMRSVYPKKGGTSSTESDSQFPGLGDIAITLEQPRHSAVIDLYHAALVIQPDIKSVKDHMSWPASPEDVDDAKANVPAPLYNLLAWILVGDSTAAVPNEGKFSEEASDEDHCQILSISQEILYCFTKDRVKIPKHVSLEMAVHHLTCSTQILSLLN